MKSPVFILPGALEALQALATATKIADLPPATIELLDIRVGQINGCSVCVDMHSRAMRKLGQSDERIFSIGAWREAPYYTVAERAALALAEALTRLSDRADAVTDEIWQEAARHYSETALAALVLCIAKANLWNRLNAATRQVGGEWLTKLI